MNTVLRTRGNRLAVLAAALVATLATAACAGVPAVGGDTVTSFTVRSSENGITAPEGVGAGISTFTFDNANTAPFGPVLARLNEGVTMDQLMETLATEGGDAALAQVTLLGGTMLEPMGSQDITYELEPGEYLVLDFGSEVEQPPMAAFEVAEAGGSGEAPEADVMVSLNDFSFDLTGELSAEPQTWQIQNVGSEWHEMFILPVESGTNESQVLEMLMDMGEQDGPPQGLTGWMPMYPGTRAWTTFDLEPGSYAVICMLPSFANQGTPHAMLGMVKVVEVAE